MGLLCYPESLALHGLPSPCEYDGVGDDAPSVGSMRMRNRGCTTIGTAITRRRPHSISQQTR
ncbi:hypothetical protein [Xenorhabdus szentirmaii]|uniref:hypothetical protein n=1 Tax=Xenorhabdus szentirmaii TaxID=290112 RepID=UPI000C0603A8|nr:hypothetical protein [Xenorhabdus szentirmaii]PHM34697.1 hypothetical protein Xsze_01130 [Xenorhabdus szentirmaii DSM 16338]PHM43438.1 hypothetical protein Xszus_03227 [Xenorhabdus szentirmaii]